MPRTRRRFRSGAWPTGRASPPEAVLAVLMAAALVAMDLPPLPISVLTKSQLGAQLVEGGVLGAIANHVARSLLLAPQEPVAYCLLLGLALCLGIFVGPAQAASRSLMARISPPDMQTEMFGLYALTGKSIAFLGPIAFGLLTDVFDSQRAGMASILVFWLVGGALLLTVKEERAG